MPAVAVPPPRTGGRDYLLPPFPCWRLQFSAGGLQSDLHVRPGAVAVRTFDNVVVVPVGYGSPLHPSTSPLLASAPGLGRRSGLL
jgi:hypothetical protein